MAMHRVLPFLWFFVAGLLMFASQLAAPLWPLTIGGLALFLFVLERQAGWKAAAWAGLWVGALKAAGGFAWIWQAYPLDWLGIDSAFLQLLLIGIYWITTSIVMGAGIALPAIAFCYLRQRLKLLILAFPFLWVAGELFGSFLVSLWLLGPGSYLNAYVGHGYAGLPLAQLDWLLPVMDMAGAYGLTWVAAFLGLSLALVISRPNKLHSGLLLLCLASLMTLGLLWPINGNNVTNVRVVAIDTNFTSASLQTLEGLEIKNREVFNAVQASLRTGGNYPDFVLLPEDSRLTAIFDGPEQTLAYLKSIAPAANTVLVDSSRVELGQGRVVLRAYYYDLGAESVYTVDKQFLVPQGEYVSHPFRFMLAILGQTETFPAIDQNQNYVPGPIDNYYGVPEHLPAILFCSESSSNVGVQNALSLRESNFILHPLSHGRFNDPWILRYQLAAMLRIQAVWNDVIVVSAGNLVSSRSYLPNGEIRSGEVLEKGSYWSLISYDLGR